MEQFADDTISLIIVSCFMFLTMITILGNCLCCRKHKKSKDEFSGLEGMVKMKTLDENDFASNANLNVAVDVSKSHGNDSNHEKRAGSAPHRSLPDIPKADVPGDNNSDLYATVGDKVNTKPQGKESPASLKKQISISQHSSISQADDFSSPYARVRSTPHDYDKVVDKEEHPYAQVTSANNRLSTEDGIDKTDGEDSITLRQSTDSTLETDGGGPSIAAASAIAGHISASQDLPYMTPPIYQPGQHFSGDSQDSSKGYTSISVREPLANLLTNQQNAQRKRKELSDSHYTTVSDDSDEMYAAIEDPNHQVDLYTSGSETYAQIQPLNQMTVSVEINQSPPEANATVAVPAASQQNGCTNTPLPPSIDSLKSQTMHSRQASASSCTSSLGYIGSPKPEKRQANSPLPPTPKTTHKSSSSNVSTSTLTSGRNSSASVIEVSGIVGIGSAAGIKMDLKASPGEKSSKKSPSKDIEGMYAKVMKKTKLFSTPSNANSINDLQNNNPDVLLSDNDITQENSADSTASPGKNSTKSVQLFDDNYETIDKKRHRSSSFTSKDPGYETIPAVKIRGQKDTGQPKSRLSAPVAIKEPGYESLPDNRDSDYDPNYEVLRPNSDDGYAKIQEKATINRLQTDGYSSIKSIRKANDLGIHPLDGVHGYARIAEKLNNNIEDDVSDIYSSIPSTSNPATLEQISSNNKMNGTILSEKDRLHAKLSECSGSDTDPNYESVRYLTTNENPYERLQSSPGASSSPIAEHTNDSSKMLRDKKDNVTDYFLV